MLRTYSLVACISAPGVPGSKLPTAALTTDPVLGVALLYICAGQLLLQQRLGWSAEQVPGVQGASVHLQVLLLRQGHPD